MKHHVLFAAFAIAGASTDLVSKSAVFSRLGLHGRVNVIDGFFEITPALNPGIIFGIAPGASGILVWIAALAIPAIAAVYLSLRKPAWISTVALGLILGGAIGNAADRVAFGAVRDFLTFYWAPGRPWHTFNIADSCIVVGVALLSTEMLFSGKHAKSEGPREPQGAA